MATRWIRLSLAAGILTAWVALSGTAVAAAPAVTISGQAFEPPTLKVAVGATVSWTNLDFAGHTVTGTAWDTGTLALGESGQTTFDEAGSFTYFCRIHPAMVGTIEVSAAAARVKHDDGTVPPGDRLADEGWPVGRGRRGDPRAHGGRRHAGGHPALRPRARVGLNWSCGRSWRRAGVGAAPGPAPMPAKP